MTGTGVSLDDWLAALAARAPTPSGGAAAAVGLAAAAALASMVARFSSDQVPDADDLAGVADSARRRALELASRDEAAVGNLLALTSGPGRQQGSRSAPRDAGAAAAQAAQVPLDIVSLAAELRPLLEQLLREGNQRLAGDARVGLELLTGAASGAAALVRIDAERLGTRDRRQLLAALSAVEEQAIGTSVDRPGRPVGR